MTLFLLLGCGRSAAERIFYGSPGSAPCGIRLPGANLKAVEARWATKGVVPASGMARFHSTLHLGPSTCITLRPGVEGVREPLSEYTEFFRVQVWVADSLIAETDVADGIFSYGKGRPNSLAVEWAPDGRAALYGGGDRRSLLLTLPAVERPDSVWVDAQSTSATVAYFAADVEPPHPSQTWPVFQPDSLSASPTDHRIAYWNYLDRENNPAVAVVGGRYRVATHPDGEGGFWIVMLEGAVTAARLWQPGQVKGRMTPTPFVDHFNLQWLDSEKTPVSDEAYAEFDATRSLLTLTFPLLQAKIRFSRAP